ncbi:hypothetical protein K9L27_03390 [Candidatus Gracilibacteria bacterium]|nr:hypothetical protein [Candidatus Gracilibacteria bacterium]
MKRILFVGAVVIFIGIALLDPGPEKFFVDISVVEVEVPNEKMLTMVFQLIEEPIWSLEVQKIYIRQVGDTFESDSLYSGEFKTVKGEIVRFYFGKDAKSHLNKYDEEWDVAISFNDLRFFNMEKSDFFTISKGAHISQKRT